MATSIITGAVVSSSLASTASFGMVELPDKGELKFGDDVNLRIHHDGSNNYISNQSNGLYIRQNANNANIFIQSDDGSGGTTTYQKFDGTEESIIFSPPSGIISGSSISTGSFGGLRIVEPINGSIIEHNAFGLKITGGAGYYPLTVTSPYETAARFLSSDGTSAIEIGDNSSTDNYNRIQVVGNSKMEFFVNNQEIIKLGPSGNTTIFNEDSLDINFRFEGADDTHLFYLDAGKNHATIGANRGNTGDEKLLVAGDVGITGSLHVSGNISTSGSIIAKEFRTEFVNQIIATSSGSTQFGDDNADAHRFTGSLNITGSNVLLANNTFFSGEDADGDDINLLGIHSNNNVYVGPSTNAYAGGYVLYGAASNTNGHVWYEGDAERMRIADNGMVGIGTNSPAAQLEVQAPTGSVPMQIRPSDPSTALNPLIMFRSQLNGTVNYLMAGNGGHLYFATYDSGTPTDVSKMIRFSPDATLSPKMFMGDDGSAESTFRVGGPSNGVFLKGGGSGSMVSSSLGGSGSLGYLRIEGATAAARNLEVTGSAGFTHELRLGRSSSNNRGLIVLEKSNNGDDTGLAWLNTGGSYSATMYVSQSHGDFVFANTGISGDLTTQNPNFVISASGDIRMNSGKKLLLDNADAEGHTYISETSDDNLKFYVGGVNLLSMIEGGTNVVKVGDGTYLGVGDSTDLYMYHTDGNSIINNGTGNLTIRNLTDDGDVILQSDNGSGGITSYITLDGSTTDLILSAPRGIKAGPNGGNTEQVFEIDTSGNSNHGLLINADEARGASRYALFVDDEDPNSRGSVVISTTSGPSLTTNADIHMAATSKLYLDGGTHTYIDESASDQLRLVAGGTEVLKGYPGGAIDMYGGSIDRRIEIGANRTGNANSYIDLIGDTTYTDYGLRLIRWGSQGVNAQSAMYHRGTGDMLYVNQESAPHIWYVNGGERMKIDNGEVVVNEPSDDVDFRVESNSQTHALFVNSGEDSVSMFGPSTGASGSLVVGKGTGVPGGILLSNGRTFSPGDDISSHFHPVGHYSTGEEVFSIDPTWSDANLSKFFNVRQDEVFFTQSHDAPGGYAIKVSGQVSVGGVYDSGFPYIPIDSASDAVYFQEMWIKNVGTDQTHYLGSNEFDQDGNSTGGNPGSFGYWVMSNTNPGSDWTYKSGYISGSSISTTGTFETSSMYWTPLALFNYAAGTGERACLVSGWKVTKVSKKGRRFYKDTVYIDQEENKPSLFVRGGGGGVDIARFQRTVGGDAHIDIHCGSDDPTISFTDSGAARTYSMGIDSSENHFKISEDNSPATNERLRISDAGNVSVLNKLSVGTTTIDGYAYILGQGNETTLKIQNNNDDTNGSFSTNVRMVGYEGRGNGTFYTDVNFSGHEWFVGTPYQGNAQIFQIGYDDGGLSEYASSGSIRILANDKVLVGNGVTGYDFEVYGRTFINDGSEGSPAYSFLNDTDTGIHRPADNQVGISTGGNTRLLVLPHKTYINSTGPNGLVMNNDEGTPTNSGRIFFEGNTTTAIMQEGDDFSIRTGASTGASSGAEKVRINASTIEMNTTEERLELGSGLGANFLRTSAGYLQLGPLNSGGCHIYTDREQFYFNKKLTIGITAGNSIIRGYNPPSTGTNGDIGFDRASNNTGRRQFLVKSGSTDHLFNGVVEFRLSQSGDFHADGDVIAASTQISSDRRLKENIEDLPYGLNEVIKLRPVEFNWIKEKRDGKHDIGVIAQEVEKIIPEIVKETLHLPMEENYKSVDYAKLAVVLVNAVKEQQEQIDELKEEIKKLKE